MRNHMEAIWRKVEERQTLLNAAGSLRLQPGGLLVKLSVSAGFGLMVALLPLTGAALVR